MVDRPAFATFGEALRHWASDQPDQPAMLFEGAACSYAALNRRANQIAHALRAEGLSVGDRIAYLGKNSDRIVELTLGAARAGVVMVPIIWRLTGPEISYILGDSSAKLFFVGDGLSDGARAAMCDAGVSPPVIAMDCASDDADWCDFRGWYGAQPDSDPGIPVVADDVAIQLYTSGTTGKPKGAMLTHANGTRLRGILDASGIDWLTSGPGEAVLNAMPYAHIAGIGTVLGAVLSGHQQIITREFDPGLTLEIIEQFRLRRMFLVPAALAIMLQHPRAATTDFSSIHTFSYGASPIPLDLLQRGIAAMQCGFAQMYGMTETWGTVVMLPPDDHGPGNEAKMRSAGKALPGVELAVLDDAGNHLLPGTLGELAIRAPSVMKGYWNRPEETAKTLMADGFLRTGDAVIIDADGYVFIQDRMKDMIITGAENVYPAEVESALYAHPDIADVAVFGVPDDRWGEAVKAVIVAVPGTTPDSAAIIAWARERLAAFKCPKSIDFIDALPRNPSGKILRRTLREPYWAGMERRVN